MLKEVLTIEEAVQFIKSNVTEIIQMAVAKELTLCFGIPNTAQLGLVNTLSPNGKLVKPLDMRTPNLLTLPPIECGAFEISSWVDCKYFPSGYYYSPTNNYLRPHHPDDSGVELEETNWPKWHTESGLDAWVVLDESGNPRSLTIKRDELLVLTRELEDLILKRYSNSVVNAGEFKSDELTYLNQAASRFWGASGVKKDDFSTHPKTDEIENWLIDRGLSKEKARVGASIIRPEFALKGRPPEI